jgi:fibronectin type 3 domain-containing protein
VSVTWTAALGATSYDVFRKAPGQSFAFLVNTGAASYSDNAVSADTSYLYKVQAKNGSGNSSDSNIDLATTTVFTDDPIVPGSTIVRAEHLLQLRTAVNAVRALAGLTAATFANEVQPGTLVHAIDITELRSALDPARSALSLPALAYTNSAAAGTVINAVDFMEIRNGMR